MVNHISIGDVSPRIQYTADGVQTVYAYPFPIFQDADMDVYLADVLQSAGFSVSGAGTSGGGDVTFTTAPQSGVTVTLRRNIAIQRTTDFQEGGEFRAKVINDELDHQTAALQQVAEQAERAVQLSPTQPSGFDATLPLPVANAVVTYNATGTGFANGPVANDIANAQVHANTAAESEVNAGKSETAAASSASKAANSETKAATSETNAAASATAAIVAKIEWLGDWSGATAYTARDAVAYQGSAYICILGHTNQTPPNTTYWELLAQRGADGIGAMSLVDSGNGLTGGPITSTGTLSLDLDATPGLEFNTGKLRIKAGAAVTLDAAGLNVDVGTTANKVVQLNGLAQLPALDASLLTNLPASNSVGDVKFRVSTAVESGWLLVDGSTLGETGSGATYVGASYQALFEHLWDNVGDTYCPVSTGRGASAAADWTAGKTLTLLDGRGRSLLMAGTGPSLTARTLGEAGGEETHTLTTNEMPAHTHSQYGSGSNVHSGSGSLSSADNVTSSTGSAGGGAAHNNMAPWLALNAFIKL